MTPLCSAPIDQVQYGNYPKTASDATAPHLAVAPDTTEQPFVLCKIAPSGAEQELALCKIEPDGVEQETMRKFY